MAVAALTSTGCAGLYAEVVAAELMTPTVTKDDSNVDMGRLSAGPMFGINLGMDFDFDRKARFAVGYAVNTYSFGDAEGTQPSSDARVDFNLVRFSNSFKLRAGLGFGMGSGGTTVGDSASPGPGERASRPRPHDRALGRPGPRRSPCG